MPGAGVGGLSPPSGRSVSLEVRVGFGGWEAAARPARKEGLSVVLPSKEGIFTSSSWQTERKETLLSFELGRNGKQELTV